MKDAGSEGVLIGLALVSSVLDGSNSVEQGSSSFAIVCSETHADLLRLSPGFWTCNLFTNGFLPRHITTQDVRSGLFGDGILISSNGVRRELR